MKIIKQTDSQMVLRQRPSPFLVLFILVWGTGFTGIPLSMIGLSLGFTSVKRLTCERIAPTQVDCAYSQSYWFDWVQPPPEKIAQVQDVVVNTETHSTDDGEYQLYTVDLVSADQTLTVAETSLEPEQAQTIATQIQTFLTSTEPTLSLNQDLRWQFNRIFPTLFCIPFVLIGVGVVYGVMQTQTLIIDRSADQLIYETSTLLGKRYKRHKLGLVQGVALKEQTDSYGNKYYEPVLLPDSVRQFTLVRTTNRPEALQMQDRILQFLKLPQPQAVEASTAANGALDKLVFEGIRGAYITTGLSELPADAPAECQELDRQLTKLSFRWTGDLRCSQFANTTFYLYTHTNKQTYAVIVQGGSGLTLSAFLTTLISGAILVTTAQKLVLRNFPSVKLFYRSHPHLKGWELYQQHGQNVIELSAQWGNPNRMQDDLAATAAVIDDYIVRQSTGGFPILAMIINLFAGAANSRQSQSKTR